MSAETLTQVSPVELNMLLDSKEAMVYSGQPNSVHIGTRYLRENVYAVYPLRGQPIDVPQDVLEGIILSRFGTRMTGQNRRILWQIMEDLGRPVPILGSGLQHLPFQAADFGVAVTHSPVLQCMVDREGINGDSPSVNWYVISGNTADYYEQDARTAGRILIDG